MRKRFTSREEQPGNAYALSAFSLAAIADAYAFKVFSADKVSIISGNSNFVLDTDQGKWLLSRIEEQSASDVVTMARILPWLEQHAFNTAKLKHLANGECLFMLDGKPAFARSFVRGDITQKLTNSMASELGKEIARLHAVPAMKSLSNNLYYEQERFTHVMKAGVDRGYEQWLAEQVDKYQRLPLSTMSRGLIHADIFWDNVLFAGKELVAIIDFEMACKYVHVFDVCMAIVGTCFLDSVLNVSLARYLLRGYQSMRALTPGETAVIPALCEYAAAKTSSWRYWRYRLTEPNHVKRDSYKEMMRVGRHFQEYGSDRLLKLLFSPLS